MAKMTLELSDGLFELRRQFEDYTHEPLILQPSDARAFQEICEVLYTRARKLENEVSKQLWNAAAREERRVTRRVLAAIEEPGSNVALFPVIARPFSDGVSPGGAA